MTVSRQLLEIHQELTALYQVRQPDLSAVQWTGAIICQQDRIFPAENQQRFWQGYFAARQTLSVCWICHIIRFINLTIGCNYATPHKARVAQRFSQSLTTYDQQAVAQQHNISVDQLLLQQKGVIYTNC